MSDLSVPIHVNLPDCALCGKPVDPENANTHRKVVGWERKRDQGGTNAVRLRVPLQEWACGFCVDKEARGVSANQGSLI